MKMTDKEIVVDAYDAYNTRDIDRLLGYLSEDVSWPDGDKRLHGREAVKNYWLNQWTQTQTHDTPTDVIVLPDGRVNVRLDQVIHRIDGSELSRSSFEYLFELRDGLIVRMDITKEL
ncbi:nuclear transport factor 2 family protein [Cyanobacteria bacterium FACHB-471]|nr:nuclear transport factor 2 family protein [Cyanobacteria bacterium FACHB-471]